MTTESKMYLTAAEAKALKLPSIDEQIARYNAALPKRAPSIKCPNCNQGEFLINLPEPSKEPHWLITCPTCRRVYELLPNGVVLAL